MKPVEAVLDTGSSRNLIESHFITSNWSKHTKWVRDSKWKDVMSKKRNLKVIMKLKIIVGDLLFRAWFIFVDKLAVEILLGKPFIDRFVERTQHKGNMVIPRKSNPIEISENYSEKISILSEAKVGKERHERPRPLFKKERQVLLKSILETPVLVI